MLPFYCWTPPWVEILDTDAPVFKKIEKSKIKRTLVTCRQCNWKKSEEKKEVKRVSRQDSAATNKAEQVSWLFHNYFQCQLVAHSTDEEGWWWWKWNDVEELGRKEGRKEGRGRQTNRRPAQPSQARKKKTHIKYHQQMPAAHTVHIFSFIYWVLITAASIITPPLLLPPPHRHVISEASFEISDKIST